MKFGESTILDICFIEPTEPCVYNACGFIGGTMIEEIESELKEEVGDAVQKWLDRGFVNLRCRVYWESDQVEHWPDGVPIVTAPGYWDITPFAGETLRDLGLNPEEEK